MGGSLNAGAGSGFLGPIDFGSADAPDDAQYWVVTADAELPNAVAIDALADGIVKHSSGVPARAVPGTDYVDPAGVSGGQTINGGLDAGDDLTLVSTANATKGSIVFGAAGNASYDEVNDIFVAGTVRVGDGTAAVPSLAFSGNTDTGFFRPGIDQVSIVCGGATVIKADINTIILQQNHLLVRGRAAKPSTGTSGVTFGLDTSTSISWLRSIVGGAGAEMAIDGSPVTLHASGSERARVTSSQILVTEAGTVGAPVLARLTDADTGLYYPGADQLAVATGAARRLSIDSGGNIWVGDGALGTTATDGFFSITGSAGPPTGTPTQAAAARPVIHFDTTNNDLYVHNGTAWVSVALT